MKPGEMQKLAAAWPPGTLVAVANADFMGLVSSSTQSAKLTEIAFQLGLLKRIVAGASLQVRDAVSGGDAAMANLFDLAMAAGESTTDSTVKGYVRAVPAKGGDR